MEPPVTTGYWRRSWTSGREAPYRSSGKTIQHVKSQLGGISESCHGGNTDTKRNNPPTGSGRRKNGRATPGNPDRSLRRRHSKEEMALQVSTLVDARAHQSKEEHLLGEKKKSGGQGPCNEGVGEAAV